jgi:(4-alkanoyl-5-oxo-2,5-dihydrofuran-3-yl)methyl phosphate reductase
MILVTGSTGNVGTHVVHQLAATGRKTRALVRDAKEATGKFPTTVDIAIGDLDSIDSLVTAMKGIERVYLLAPFTPSLVKQEANVIEAARRAGVKHVVKHSVLGAQYEAIALGRWHRTGEKSLEASGMAWTHLRPSGFFTNTLGWAQMIKSGGTVYYPTGDGKLAIIDPRDVAAVAVKTLTENGHEAKSYELTGAQALSTQEQVDVIGRAIGKPVKFVNVPDQAARDSMLGQGMPPQIVDMLIEFTGVIRANQASLVTDTVQKISGRQPRTFEAWVKENVSAFK